MMTVSRFTLFVCAVAAACSAQQGKLDAAAERDAASLDSATLATDWCAALVVLRAKCQRCHRDPPENGAPFPLLTYADTQRTIGQGATVIQSKIEVVVATDRMPATFVLLDPAVEPLTPEEKQAILRWARQPALDPVPECGRADQDQ